MSDAASRDQPRIVTVGGLPGTGTSTLCRLLQERLGWPYVYAGQLFRDEAAQRGLSLADFGALCQQDASVDQALDARQAALLSEASAQGDGLILEGRLAGWLAHRDAVPSRRVWVTCDDDERARRLAERDGGDVQAQREAMLVRERSEADRYNRYYGIDLGDLAPYDLVLDSTKLAPLDLVDAVVASLRA